MPKSRLPYKLDEAIGYPGDWSFTWSLRDDVAFGTTCGFCGQTGQRLSYEVQHDAETRWVCQRCVGRYPFGGVLDGVALDPQVARDHMHGLSARLKQRTCRDVILRAYAAMEDPTLMEVAAYFSRNLQLSPRHAACLFWAMSQMEEATDIRAFDVQTRSAACKSEFGALDGVARAMIWPALSPQQRRGLTALGYAPHRAKGSYRARAGQRENVGAAAHG